MADITAEDLAALVGSANELVQTFENKESDISAKINELSQAVVTALSGNYKFQILYVDGLLGDDINPGSQASPLKTITAAVEKSSSLFSVNIIRLKGDYVYHIDGSPQLPSSALVFFVGIDSNSFSSIRGGATDNRPTISVQTNAVPGDGKSFQDSESISTGLDAYYGANVHFFRCHLLAPQGFENDNDKNFIGDGSRIIRRSGNFSNLSAGFTECKITTGLGGLVLLGSASNSIKVGACDIYVNTDAPNPLSNSIFDTSVTSLVSYKDFNNVFFDVNTGLELSPAQSRNAVFSHLVYLGQSVTDQPKTIMSNLNFSREALGLV